MKRNTHALSQLTSHNTTEELCHCPDTKSKGNKVHRHYVSMNAIKKNIPGETFCRKGFLLSSCSEPSHLRFFRAGPRWEEGRFPSTLSSVSKPSSFRDRVRCQLFGDSPGARGTHGFPHTCSSSLRAQLRHVSPASSRESLWTLKRDLSLGPGPLTDSTSPSRSL